MRCGLEDVELSSFMLFCKYDVNVLGGFWVGNWREQALVL